MKRIMNDVAVQTLLYTMCPQAQVCILDRPHYFIPNSDPISSIENIYVCTVDEILHDCRNAKIARSKVYRTRMKDNMMILLIDTQSDQY